MSFMKFEARAEIPSAVFFALHRFMQDRGFPSISSATVYLLTHALSSRGYF